MFRGMCSANIHTTQYGVNRTYLVLRTEAVTTYRMVHQNLNTRGLGRKPRVAFFLRTPHFKDAALGKPGRGVGSRRQSRPFYQTLTSYEVSSPGVYKRTAIPSRRTPCLVHKARTTTSVRSTS
jgi:hypothetical protein